MRILFRRRRIRLSRKKESLLARRAVALILLLTLTVWVTAALYHKASPIAVDNAAAMAEANREALLYTALEEVLAEGDYSYDSFARYEKDATGKVIAVFLNTEVLSAFRSALYEKANAACQREKAISVAVPIGTLLAPKFFGGRGFSITVGATAYTVLSISLTSEITAAGINQTLHRITLSIEANTNLYCLKEKRSFPLSLTVPLAETLVYGNVPEGIFEYTG